MLILLVELSLSLQARRQQRKLNFLITQTELYAHFMAKKLTGTFLFTADMYQLLCE